MEFAEKHEAHAVFVTGTLRNDFPELLKVTYADGPDGPGGLVASSAAQRKQLTCSWQRVPMVEH